MRDAQRGVRRGCISDIRYFVMVLLLLIGVFLVTVLSGPAGRDYLRRRKSLKERPLAKVIPFPYPPKHPRKT